MSLYIYMCNIYSGNMVIYITIFQMFGALEERSLRQMRTRARSLENYVCTIIMSIFFIPYLIKCQEEIDHGDHTMIKIIKDMVIIRLYSMDHLNCLYKECQMLMPSLMCNSG